MVVFRVRFLFLIIACLLMASTASAKPVTLDSDRIKLEDNFYVTFYCHVADGSAKPVIRTLSKALTLFGPIQTILFEAGLDEAALEKGDGYCVWIHVSKPKHNIFRRSRFKNMATAHFRIIGADGKVVGKTDSGTCQSEARTYCGTTRISGGGKGVGFTGCFEPVMPNGKKGSIVIAKGQIGTIAQTDGNPKAASCADRAAEYEPSGK